MCAYKCFFLLFVFAGCNTAEYLLQPLNKALLKNGYNQDFMYDVSRYICLDKKDTLYMHHHIHKVILTSPLMRTQSSESVAIVGFPNSQLVKVTAECSLQSNSPSVLLSFSPIQSSSVDAADMAGEEFTSDQEVSKISRYWFHPKIGKHGHHSNLSASIM